MPSDVDPTKEPQAAEEAGKVNEPVVTNPSDPAGFIGYEPTVPASDPTPTDSVPEQSTGQEAQAVNPANE